jgi:hypothetical protein
MHTRRKLLTSIAFAALTCACTGLLMCGIVQAQPAAPRGSGPAVQMFEKMLDNPNYPRLKEVQVENWLGTEEARFAHALKIPNPVPVDSGYRPGMTQQQYFEHLCRNEAGEFIFKTADNVEGIFQMRPRRFMYETVESQHLYAMEDPYGYWAGENDNPGYQFTGPTLYAFLEAPPEIYRKEYAWIPRQYDKSLSVPPSSEAKIARFFGYDNQTGRSQKLEYDIKPKARYGFTWRGIKRPNDREMGIAGGELIVLDLQTKEVTGVRRGYVIWNGGWTGRVCPLYEGSQSKATYFSAWFLAKVARPPRYKEFLKNWGRLAVAPNAMRN